MSDYQFYLEDLCTVKQLSLSGVFNATVAVENIVEVTCDAILDKGVENVKQFIDHLLSVVESGQYKNVIFAWCFGEKSAIFQEFVKHFHVNVVPMSEKMAIICLSTLSGAAAGSGR